MEALDKFIKDTPFISYPGFFTLGKLSSTQILKNVNKLLRVKLDHGIVYQAPILTMIAKVAKDLDSIFDVMNFILSKNPNVNILDTQERNVLVVLTRNVNIDKEDSRYIDIARNILSRGLNVNALDKDRNSTFYYLFMEESPIVFDIIKLPHFNVNIPSYSGTAVQVVVSSYEDGYIYLEELFFKFFSSRMIQKVLDPNYRKKVFKQLMLRDPDLTVQNNGVDVFALLKQIRRKISRDDFREINQFLSGTRRIKNIGGRIIKEIKKTKAHPFKWQTICGEFGNNNLSTLQQLAIFHGINPGKMNKRELCQALAIQTEKLKNPTDCANDISILGDPVEDIPAYLLYSFEENGRRYCFNIVELNEYIDKGNTTNPFTRQPLDIEQIEGRFEILKKMLNENALGMVNIIEQIRNNPIMDKKTILKLAITNLTAGMSYPPTVDQIMKFNDNQLKTVIEYVNNNPIFPKFRGEISIENVISFMTGAITGENRELKLVALEQYLLDINTGSINQ